MQNAGDNTGVNEKESDQPQPTKVAGYRRSKEGLGGSSQSPEISDVETGLPPPPKRGADREERPIAQLHGQCVGQVEGAIRNLGDEFAKKCRHQSGSQNAFTDAREVRRVRLAVEGPDEQRNDHDEDERSNLEG